MRKTAIMIMVLCVVAMLGCRKDPYFTTTPTTPSNPTDPTTPSNPTDPTNPTTGAWVDLGLPSGLLWASCNLGASSPEQYGNYYAWGETRTKTTYDWSTYRWCNGSYNTLTRYCNNSGYGYNGLADNLTTLQPSDDAATAVLGNGARMPMQSEWVELLNNTTSSWTTLNGVYGRKFTAANGNSIFLPAAGYRYGSGCYYAGTGGYYWSSSLRTEYPNGAWYCYFGSDGQSVSPSSRGCGQSVRAVRASQN